MKLYIVHGSPNCRKVLAVAHHLGVDAGVTPLNFGAGDLRSSDYQQVNPNCMVPALTDGTLNLWESNAIMQYLCMREPTSTLFPSDPAVRADIVRWQFWEVAHFNRALAGIVFENFIKRAFGLGEPDPAALERSTAEFHRFAPMLENRLSGRKYVVGEDVTLADFSLGAQLMYAQPARVPLSLYPNITSWYQRLEAVPAWKKSAPPQ